MVLRPVVQTGLPQAVLSAKCHRREAGAVPLPSGSLGRRLFIRGNLETQTCEELCSEYPEPEMSQSKHKKHSIPG